LYPNHKHGGDVDQTQMALITDIVSISIDMFFIFSTTNRPWLLTLQHAETLMSIFWLLLLHPTSKLWLAFLIT